MSGLARARHVRSRTGRNLSGFPEFFEHLAGLPKSVIAHRHPAIDRLLQNDFLNIVGREAALDERCAQVHAKLLPPPDRHHGADDEDAARALVEMRSRPDLAQAQRVMKSCHSALNESLLASARSTQA